MSERTSRMRSVVLACAAALGVSASTASVAVAAPVLATDANATTGAVPPYVVSNSDLLQLPGTTLATANAVDASNGAFRNDEGGALNPNALRDGTFGQGRTGHPVPDGQVIGNGGQLTYTLPGAFNLSQIGTYSGWADNGRDDQNYSVYTSTNGTDFTLLRRVDFGVGSPNHNSRVLISDDSAPFLALGVTAVRFTFGDQFNGDPQSGVENNGVGYRELDVIGVAVPEPSGLAALGAGALLLARRRRHRM
jgi:hypothetical protein